MDHRGRPIVFLALWLAFACGSAADAATIAVMNSDTGDYIGGGVSRTITPVTTDFVAERLLDGGIEIRLENGPEWWNFAFSAAGDAPLAVGTYLDATRWPFNANNAHGLSASGAGRGCNQLTGSFTVHELVVDQSDVVQQFAADFVQHCEGARPALFGFIRFESNVPVPPDTDGDGRVDPADNCPALSNVSQANLDGDQLGDACDPYPESTDNEAGTTHSFLVFDSDPGDYIGQGIRRTWTLQDGRIVGDGGAHGVLVSFDTGGSTYWNLHFLPPTGELLAPGEYVGAERAAFHSANRPGLAVTGSHRGCNDLTGRFVIHELVIDDDGDVARFAADFEQFCDGSLAALVGGIRLNSAVPAPPDGDGDGALDIGDNCAATANLDQRDADQDGLGDACDPFPLSPDNVAGTTRTVLLFDSDANDWIGNGEAHRWDGRHGLFAAARWAGGVTIDFDGGSTNWELDFVAPGVGRLGPGTYENAERHPFQSPTRPGLSVSGSGRGCNTLSGRFVVLELVTDDVGTLTQFAADFEQHCEGGASALRGAIRYRSAVPTPPDGDQDDRFDGSDNCPTTPNTDQHDADEDGIGDVCDPTPNPPATGCDAIAVGPTFASVLCRLELLQANVSAAVALGTFRGKLATSVDTAIERTHEAQGLCAASDAKKTKKRLLQASKAVAQYTARLNSRGARRKIQPELRRVFLEMADGIGPDLRIMRATGNCPA